MPWKAWARRLAITKMRREDETMKITREQIMSAVPTTDGQRVDDFVRVFNEWNDKFGISTPLRVAHFLAQCWHECNELKALEENMNYSEIRLLQVFPKYFSKSNAYLYAYRPEKIANRVYANRMGNGSEGSGDGWRYRGRGMIGITGFANYKAYAFSGFCVGDLMRHPEWLAKSPGAYKSAMWFWWKNKLNTLADRDYVKSVTQRINGGYNGLESRKEYLAKFKEVLGC